MKTIAVGKLIFDFNLYPRSDIDGAHVSYLVDVLRANVELPPMVIEEKTSRIVDGFHRCKAYLKVHGPGHEVEVIAKRYKGEGELLLDAIRYNAQHGRRMSTFDRAHAALKALELHVSKTDIAAVLSIKVERLDQILSLRGASVRSIVGTSVISPNDQHIQDDSIGKPGTIALKGTIRHKAGMNLTKAQQDVNRKLGGMNQLFYVHQIIMLIENDLLDSENEPLMEALERLGDLIRGLKVGQKV